MFKIGDIVEITEESDATGMLDFKKGKGYKVEVVQYNFNGDFKGHVWRHQEILLRDEGGRADWYHYTHFKLKGEEAVEKSAGFKVGDRLICIASEADCRGNYLTPQEEYEVITAYQEGVVVVGDDGDAVWVYNHHFKLKEDTKVEKEECLFKKGQVVWDLRNGRGVVEEIVNDVLYPVKVKFDLKDKDGDEIVDYYLADGRYAKTQTIRSLYFSEPKIEAATEPVFEPTLKEGDVVIISGFKDRAAGEDFKIGVVEEETDEFVYTTGNDPWDKYARDFYRLGEKINFK